MNRNKLTHWLDREACALGFDQMAITPAGLDRKHGDDLYRAIARNFHGTMDWLAETRERRSDPQAMWAEARSVILLVMNYAPEGDPLNTLGKPDKGNISVYARHRDYHDVMKGRLKILAGKFAARTSAKVKVFVDTAPLMEKPLAQKAGLGWQGKHTNLVSRKFGSWLFIGSILTDLELAAHGPEVDHCGSCRACLDACPTNAFPAPYQLDARRCISYLTIEHKGQIAPQFRKAMGNRIYGCDDCLAVCPWNKFAQDAREAKLQARADLIAPDLAMLLGLDDATFRKFFSGSPVKRIGRNRFIRNCLIAAGNSGDPALIAPVTAHLGDGDPLLHAIAVWAFRQLSPPVQFEAARQAALAAGCTDEIRREWTQ